MVMGVDIIVVNYQRYDLLSNFLGSLYANPPLIDYEVIVVDNDPIPGEISKVDLKDAHLLEISLNVGYAKAINFGLEVAKNDYVGIFNNDIRFTKNPCIDLCVDALANDESIGVVGPMQYNSRGAITHAGIMGDFGDGMKYRGWLSTNRSRFSSTDYVDMISGSAMFLRREVLDEMALCRTYQNKFPSNNGPLPPFPHFYEDTLLNYHLHRHGYSSVYLGKAEIIHDWHQSSPVGSHASDLTFGRKMFLEFKNMHS